MHDEQKPFTVGRTLRTTPEHPDGMPCILMDGDSVLCEFPGQPGTMRRAVMVCDLLNAALLEKQRKGFL